MRYDAHPMSSNTPLPPKDRIFLGIACVCVAFFMFTAMQAISKTMMDRHHVAEFVFWRNILAAVPMTIFIFAGRRFDLFKTDMPIALSLRVVIGTLAMIATIAAMKYLPMANATVLFFASTLITPVAAHFVLKEHIGLHRWIAVFVGLSGVLLIAQPSAEFAVLGVVFGLLAAGGHSFAHVSLRYLRQENPMTVIYYFFAGGAVISALFLPFVGSVPAAADIDLFLLIGLTGGLGQYFLTVGLRSAPASVLNPFNYTGLIWATGFDIVLFGYLPSWHVYAGAGIIFAAYLYIVYRERRQYKK